MKEDSKYQFLNIIFKFSKINSYIDYWNCISNFFFFENSTRNLRTNWFNLKKKVFLERTEKDNAYKQRFFNLFNIYFRKSGFFFWKMNCLDSFLKISWTHSFAETFEEKNVCRFWTELRCQIKLFFKKVWIFLWTYIFSKILNWKNFQFSHNFWRIWIFFEKWYIILFTEKSWKNFIFDISTKNVFLNLYGPRKRVIFS